jgi:hypothetical protein
MMQPMVHARWFFAAIACACGSTPAIDAGMEDAGLDAGMATVDAGKGDAGRDEPDAARTELDAGDAASSCGTSFAALIDGLFYTSEGDYPLLERTFAGEGDVPPTAETILRLSEAPSGATTELRDVDYFFDRVVVDPTRDPPIPSERPAMLRAAFEGQLSNLIVVRVTDPAEPVLIGVYLAGTNACGELVWLSSTAVET